MAIAPPPSPSRRDPAVAEPPTTSPSPAPAQTTAPTRLKAPDEVAILRCAGLRKRFGERQAVDGVGFTIAPGETYGLLGPNGAGKTTTISMVCGILRRDEGEVVDRRTADGSERHRAEGRDRLCPPGPGDLSGSQRDART